MKRYFEKLCSIVIDETTPVFCLEFTAKIRTESDYFEDGNIDYKIEGITDNDTADVYEWKDFSKEDRILIESYIGAYIEKNYDEITDNNYEVI